MNVSRLWDDILRSGTEEEFFCNLIPFTDSGCAHETIRLSITATITVIFHCREDSCDGEFHHHFGIAQEIVKIGDVRVFSSEVDSFIHSSKR